MIGTTRQKIQIALYTLSLFLATTGLVCRLWARRYTRTRWQVNDYLMVLAYMNVLGLVIVSNMAVTVGEMGVHQYDIPKDKLAEAIPFNLKMTIAMPFFLISSSFFVKMSITHFYTVLFSHIWLHKLCRIQLYLLTLCWIAGIVPCFLACRPLAYTWDRTLPGGGQCFDVKRFWFWTSIVALFFDLTCVVLPIPVFWSLRTSTAKKIKLTLVFGLGFFICGLTIGRIYYDEQIQFSDLPYTSAPAIMFTVPEPSLGIVAGCLPITMPLFARASSAIRSTFTTPPKLGTVRSRTATELSNLKSLSFGRRRKLSMRDEASFKRLQDHLYPMTSVVVDRSSFEEECLRGVEQLRATEELMRRNGVRGDGITVLREVRVERGA